MISPVPKSLRAQLEEDIQSERRDLAWRAVAQIKKLLRSEGDSAELRDFLGRAFCVLRDAAASEENHRRSIRMEPAKDSHWFNFSVSLFKLDRQTQAIDAMLRAADLASDHDMPAYYLARWYACLERPDLALPWIDKCVGVSPTPSRFVWRALIRHSLGNIEGAQEDLQQSFRGFLKERVSEWLPSSEQAWLAFVGFVCDPNVAAEWARHRIEEIRNGTRTTPVSVESDPELKRLQAIVDTETEAPPTSLNAAGLMQSYEEILPFAADAIASGIGESWPVDRD